MKTYWIFFLALIISQSLYAQQEQITVERDYLALPIDADGEKAPLLLLNGGDTVARLNVALAADTADFISTIPVKALRGRQLTVVNGRGLIGQSDTIPGTFYREQYRPAYHYSPRTGWVNDPNGLVHYNGTWHLFYQYYPHALSWDIMHWGHATSPDLVHWTERDPAIGQSTAGGAFSGGGVVDWKNTTGFQTGEHPPILLYYTAAAQHGFTPPAEKSATQRLVYSVDGGQSWQEYAGNPVIPSLTRNFEDRDPKVFWYEPGQHWVLIMFAGKGTFSIHNSKNGLDWVEVSRVTMEGQRECPDLFEVQVDGKPGQSKWVFLSGWKEFYKYKNAHYVVGDFDGQTFTPEQEAQPVDEGIGNYSTQTFSDAPEGRRIFVGWFTRQFKGAGYPGMPANGQFRVPWELELYERDGRYLLRRYPVKELEQLRRDTFSAGIQQLTFGDTLALPLPGRAVDLELTLEPSVNGAFTLDVGGMPISYDATTGQISAFGQTARVGDFSRPLRLRILLDRTSLEVFVNGGETVLSGLLEPAQMQGDVVSLAVTREVVRVRDFWMYGLRSYREAAVEIGTVGER